MPPDKSGLHRCLFVLFTFLLTPLAQAILNLRPKAPQHNGQQQDSQPNHVDSHEVPTFTLADAMNQKRNFEDEVNDEKYQQMHSFLTHECFTRNN